MLFVLLFLGTGFSTTASDIAVEIGGVACNNPTATATEITCTIGDSPSGNQAVSVLVGGKGAF